MRGRARKREFFYFILYDEEERNEETIRGARKN